MHLVDKPRHQPRTAFPEEYFEDGTLPFLQVCNFPYLNYFLLLYIF